jgi:large repetitive protein
MRSLLRALAVTTSAALAVGGLAVPASAATSITCVTNPINNQNTQDVRFSGKGAAMSPQSVSVRYSFDNGPEQTASSQVVFADASGNFSGSFNLHPGGSGPVLVPDGPVFIEASGIDGTQRCETFRDGTPPNAPTVTTTPAAVVTPANQAALQVSAAVSGADLQSVTLTVAGGSFSQSRTLLAGSSPYNASFDVTGYPEGATAISVTAVARDIAGNETASAVKTLRKDTVAPASPSIAFTDPAAANPVTGEEPEVETVTVETPGTGNKVKVTVATAEASTYVVTVTDSAGTTQTLTTPATTATSATAEFDPYAFADGPLSVAVTPTDAYGNQGPTAAATLVKDSSAPVLVAVPTVDGGPTGFVNADRADDTVVSGEVRRASGSSLLSETGTSVRIVATGPQTLGMPAPVTADVEVGPDGRYSATMDLSSLTDGALTITATPTDPAGNAGPSRTANATKDTGSPAAPAVVTVENATPATVTAVDFSGTAGGGATLVDVTATDASGAVFTALDLPVTSGVWSGSFDATSWAQGVYTLRATSSDAAGNNSAVSGPRTGTKDTVTMVIEQLFPGSGAVASPSTAVSARFSEPLVQTGTFSRIELLTAGNAAVDGGRTFSSDGQTITFTPVDPLPDGTYTANVFGRSAYPGGESVSGSFTFSVDAAAPAAPVLDPLPAFTNAATTASGLTVTGTAEPGSTVVVTVVDTPPAMSLPPNSTPRTATSSAVSADAVTGAFSALVNIATPNLRDGVLTATARATDQQTNQSPVSLARTTTKDTVAPEVTGAAATNVRQSSPTTTVTASTSAATAFSVTLSKVGSSATVVRTGTSDGNGAVSIAVDPTGLPQGSVNVAVVATDAAGNPSSPGNTSFDYDVTGPTVTGLSATPVKSDSSGTTTVTGQTGEGGTSVVVSVEDADGTTVFPATQPTPAASSPGAFSTPVDVSSLDDGVLTVRVVPTDGKGNVGSATTTTTTKDTVSPTVTGLAATPTNATDPTTTVTGMTEPLATVALSATDGVRTVNDSAVAGPTGSFTRDLDLTGFADGTVTVTATATDVIGNVGPSASTGSARDTAAPAITGLASTSTTAAQRSTTVTGTTDPGATVALSATSPGSAQPVTGTATAGPSGTFSRTLDLTSLADGTVTVSATATDLAGNVGSAVTATSVKDTQGPGVSGLSATDVNAASTVTTVTGTVSEAGADVVVTATDGTTSVSRTLSDLTSTSLSTTLDLATLADKADVLVTAVATDAAGNAGTAATDTLAKDTVGPAVTGLSATSTSSGTPATTVTGTTEAGRTVTLSVTTPGSAVPSTTTATAGSDGSFTKAVDTSGLQDGRLTVTASATDAAGNTGPTATFSDPAVVKDATGPVVATLSATPTKKDATTTTVTGMTEPGATLALSAVSSAGGTPVTGTATAAGDGAFTKALDVASLPDGTITVTATATDAVGNAGPAKTATAGKDTAPPALSGLGATGTTQASPKTTVSGTTDPGQVVTVTVTQAARSATGTATGAASTGAFTVDVDLASFADGAFQVAASATDAAGNTSSAGPVEASKDATGPTVTGLAATATNATSGSTTVTGATAAAGESVTVTATDGTKTVTTTVVTGADKAFTAVLDLTGFADAAVAVTAVAKDALGNSGPTSSTTSARDTTRPVVATLSTGTAASGSTSPTVSGTTEKGSAVTLVVADATKSVSKTVVADAGTGAFSTTVDVSSLADGTLTTTATAVDPAGNASAAPAKTATSTKDTVAPTVAGLTATASTSSSPATSVRGTSSEAGAVTVTARDGNGATRTGSASTTGSGSFVVAVDLTGLADGSITVTATATDGVGNTSSPATATTTRDTRTVPAAPAKPGARAGDASVRVLLGAAPANGGSAITGYVARVVQTGRTVTAPASATSILVTGLVNGTAYTFTVAATNAKGTGPASPATDAVTPRFATVLSLAGSPTTAVAGSPLRLTGSLKRKTTGAALGGFRVSVTARFDNGTTKALGTVATSSSGVWSLTTTPTQNATYTVSYAGRPQDAPTSFSRRILTRTKVTLSAPSGSAGSALVMSGSTSPNKRGAVVTVFRVVNGAETKVASATVSSTGTYRVSKVLARGTYVLVARIGPTTGNTSGVSPRVTTTRR